MISTMEQYRDPFLVQFFLVISPDFELKNVVAYADDTYKMTSPGSKENLLTDIGEALTAISLWFWSSGLKVNEEKTEIAILNKDNCNPKDVLVNGMIVRTKGTIKALGITMDTMLTWIEHINNTISNV